jgi:hypothetical protein
MQRSIFAVPAAPGISATITLFDSTVAFGVGQMAALGIARVGVNFLNISHGSAASGFKAYSSSNGGTTWDQIDFGSAMPATVSASTPNVDDVRDFLVSQYPELKLTYTNGGTSPTPWRVYGFYTDDVAQGVS